MAMFPTGPMKIALVALAAITLVAVLAACGGGQEATSSDGRVQPLAVGSLPTVTWAPASITMTANPGTRQDIPLTLTAVTAMSNVTLSVPTTLRTAVSITPTSLGTLKSGQRATVTVTVAPSASEAIRTLSGSITVRSGFAAIGKSLPISLSLVTPELINGIAVPPEPPKELNDLTLAGIDLNKNSVRDDVERLIAKEFGISHPKVAQMTIFAKSEQTAIVVGTGEAVLANARAFLCGGLAADETNKLTTKLLNTPERGERYRIIMAAAPNVVIGEGC